MLLAVNGKLLVFIGFRILIIHQLIFLLSLKSYRSTNSTQKIFLETIFGSADGNFFPNLFIKNLQIKQKKLWQKTLKIYRLSIGH
jgi:hypothetical protein